MLRAVGEELVELLFRRQIARRLEVIDDRERHDHAAAPRRHLVNVKVEPIRQQDDFRRDDRQVLPRILAEHGEEELGVRVGSRDAAEAHDGGVGADHARVVGLMPGKLEREVGLERGVELARPLVVGVPAAVEHLAVEQVLDAARLLVEIDLARPVHERDYVRDQRAVDVQLAHPITVRLLQPEQMLLRAADRLLDAVGQRQVRLLAKRLARNLDGLR